jgi:hypothetical protein
MTVKHPSPRISLQQYEGSFVWLPHREYFLEKTGCHRKERVLPAPGPVDGLDSESRRFGLSASAIPNPIAKVGSASETVVQKTYEGAKAVATTSGRVVRDAGSTARHASDSLAPSIQAKNNQGTRW